MDPIKAATLIVEIVAGILLLVFIAWLLHGTGEMIEAPAKLDAALGVNAAQHEAGVDQNKGVESLDADSKNRKAASTKAAAAAGTKEYADAQRISAMPAQGSTALERAANRINSEFGK